MGIPRVQYGMLLPPRHRYQVVPRFKKTLQKRDICHNIHNNCADNPVKWTTFNIELFVIYKVFKVPMKRNLNFRATSPSVRKWRGNSNFASYRPEIYYKS